MKISELLEKLQEVQNTEGDIKTATYDEDGAFLHEPDLLVVEVNGEKFVTIT